MKLGKYTGGGQQKEIAPPNQVGICYSKQVYFIDMKRTINIEIKYIHSHSKFVPVGS